jgi:hypothetical protein
MERSPRNDPGERAVGYSGAGLFRRGAELFARDAEAWGLTPRQALILALFPIAATLAFLGTVPFPGLFRWVNDEDSLMETEISVHNIYGFHQRFIYAVMLGGMYGAVAPLVRSAFSARQPRSNLSYLLIPPLCLVPAFFMPFGYRLYRLLFLPNLSHSRGYGVFVITEFNELTELCLYFGLVVFAWLNLRRLRQERTEHTHTAA